MPQTGDITTKIPLQRSKSRVDKNDLKERKAKRPPPSNIPPGTVSHVKEVRFAPEPVQIRSGKDHEDSPRQRRRNSSASGSAAVQGGLKDGPVQTVRKQALDTLQSMLDQDGLRLAELCIDDVLSQAGDQFSMVATDDFLNAMKRSIVAVQGKDVPSSLKKLAFRLSFNLDFRSRLDAQRKGSDSHATQTAVSDQGWQDVMAERLGAAALAVVVSAEGMSQAMLESRQNADQVFNDSLAMSSKLLGKILPSRLPANKIPAYANLAMALRNATIHEYELRGEPDKALQKALVKKAEALLKLGGQADAVQWTFDLLETVEARAQA